MLLQARQKYGAVFFGGKEYTVDNHKLDMPDDLAVRLLSKGQYTLPSKYLELSDKCRSFLMIRGNGLGDVLLCYPVRKAIIDRYPKIEIDVVTAPEYVQVLEGDPTIRTLYSENKLIKLKNFKYDFVINLNHVEFINSIGAMHKADLFAMECKIPYPIKHKTLFYSIRDDEKQIGIDATKNVHHPIIGLVLRSTCNCKHLPLEELSRLTNLIMNEGCSIIIFDKDRNFGRKFKKSCENGEKIINSCGRHNIRGCSSVLNQCDVIITPDTGFMHLSMALKKKVIAYFGSIGKDLVITEGDLITVEPDIKCYPCNRFDCPRNDIKCLKDLYYNIFIVMKRCLGLIS